MFFTILSALTGLGGLVRGIEQDLTNLGIAKINATTEKEKAELSAKIEALHDKRAVLVAEAGSRLNAIIRGVAAGGPVVYITKVFVWDKVLGSFFGYTPNMFQTDPLDPNLWNIVMVVFGFYFVADMVNKGVSAFKNN